MFNKVAVICAFVCIFSSCKHRTSGNLSAEEKFKKSLPDSIRYMEYVNVAKGSSAVLKVGGWSYSAPFEVGQDIQLSATPITEKQYIEVLGRRKQKNDNPVTKVNYFDAEQFVNALNEMTKDNPNYSYSFRLPNLNELAVATKNNQIAHLRDFIEWSTRTNIQNNETKKAVFLWKTLAGARPAGWDCPSENLVLSWCKRGYKSKHLTFRVVREPR